MGFYGFVYITKSLFGLLSLTLPLRHPFPLRPATLSYIPPETAILLLLPCYYTLPSPQSFHPSLSSSKIPLSSTSSLPHVSSQTYLSRCYSVPSPPSSPFLILTSPSFSSYSILSLCLFVPHSGPILTPTTFHSLHNLILSI